MKKTHWKRQVDSILTGIYRHPCWNDLTATNDSAYVLVQGSHIKMWYLIALLLSFQQTAISWRGEPIGMVIPHLMGNPCDGYVNPCCWVDDHGNHVSLDASTHGQTIVFQSQGLLLAMIKIDEKTPWFEMIAHRGVPHLWKICSITIFHNKKTLTKSLTRNRFPLSTIWVFP